MKIEALVLEEVSKTLETILREKWETMERLAEYEAGMLVPDNLVLLKKKLEEEGIEYEKIERKIREKYEEVVQITKENLIKKYPDAFEDLKKNFLIEELKKNLDLYLEIAQKSLSRNECQNLKKLIETIKMPKKKFDEEYKDASYEATIRNIKSYIEDKLLPAMVENSEFRSYAFQRVKIDEDLLVKKLVKEKKNSRELVVIPKEKMDAFKEELREALKNKLIETYKEKFEHEKKELFSGEWSFAEELYKELVEQKRRENDKN